MKALKAIRLRGGKSFTFNTFGDSESALEVMGSRLGLWIIPNIRSESGLKFYTECFFPIFATGTGRHQCLMGPSCDRFSDYSSPPKMVSKTLFESPALGASSGR